MTLVYPHVDAGLAFHCSLLRHHGADSAGHGLCVYVCVFVSLSPLSPLSLSLSLSRSVCLHTHLYTHLYKRTPTHTHTHKHTHTCGDEALVIAEVLDLRIPSISLSPPQPFHLIIIIIIIIMDRQELLPTDIGIIIYMGNYY